MSDTNRVALAIIKEVTPGTTPATPAWQAMRITGTPNLANVPSIVTSNELAPDRQISDRPLVGQQAGGDIGFEMSPDALDETWEAALWSAWINKPVKFNAVADTEIKDIGTVADTYEVDADGATYVTGHLVRAEGNLDTENNQRFRVLSSTATTVVGTSLGLVADTAPQVGSRLRVVGFEGAADDIDAAITPNRLTSTLLDFTTLGLVVGEWIKIGGSAAGQKFTDPNLSGWARISAIAAGVLTFDIVPTGWAAEASSGGKTLQCWIGDYIRNGVVENTYALERQFQDHSPITFEYFNQMTLGVLALTVTAQSILTGSSTWLGTKSNMTETRFVGSTDVAAPTEDVMNSSSHVVKIGENGAEVAGPNFVLAFGININNQLRGQPAVGQVGLADIGAGEADITGVMTTYFGNKDLAEKVINNTATDTHMVLENGILLKAIVMDLPRVKFIAGAPSVPGKNNDVTVPLEFGANKHETLGYTMHVQRHHETV